MSRRAFAFQSFQKVLAVEWHTQTQICYLATWLDNGTKPNPTSTRVRGGKSLLIKLKHTQCRIEARICMLVNIFYNCGATYKPTEYPPSRQLCAALPSHVRLQTLCVKQYSIIQGITG